MGAWLRGFRVLMAFSFRASPWRAALFLLSGAVMSLIYPVAAYGSKLLVDAAVAGELTGALVAAALLALTMGVGLINGLYYIDLLFTVAERAGAEVDRRLIRLMAEVPGIEHHELPEYLDRLDLLREERAMLGWMTNATAGLLRVAVQLVASGVLLARLHPALLLLPLFGVVSFLAGRRAQELHRRAEEATAEPERLRKHLFDTATNAAAGKEVRVFGLAGELIERHHTASASVMGRRDRADWQSAGLRSVDALVSAAAYAGAIGLVLVLAVRGRATPGDVVLAVGLTAGMNAIVATAVGYGTHFLRVLRVAGRFLWLEDYAQRADRDLTEPVAVPEKLESGIEVRDLGFRYPGSGTPVLDGVSLALPAGSVVALGGENGAGKTTLVKLLTRMYEPTEGAILVDGVDLSRFDVGEWRWRVSAAFQDFARFELLAREAVGVGDVPRLADREPVGAALTRAGAGDLPGRLPRGLETQLGRDWEGGVELSGGQWQKLALGRAMMRDRPLLLVLDEPTASLDAQAEHELFERYAEAARRSAASAGTVTVLVSHRFSTVRMADLIVVLEDGRVREMGAHEGLMARGGLYAELYELQARAYR
ncbi:MAG: ABC transporter ATP-binding protein/permease [Actinomycetota bacterium]|nr:ABC transporter ATP-binding protein/permease [Actinomycetota bacterium]